MKHGTSPNCPRLRLQPDGSITIAAPAKLNLGLRIFEVREDGYHPIESWFVPISFYDTIRIIPQAAFELSVTGQTTAIPEKLTDNLVGKAALALFKAGGQQPRGRIVLHKIIPPGGGLGGGSSDAAAALLALNAAFSLGMSAADLEALALSLGSDVPFFIPCRSAVCRGRGEIMEPLDFSYTIYAVLLIPPQGVSTRLVYEYFDRSPQPELRPTLRWSQLAQAEPAEINATIRNDLASPAFAIAPWLDTLRADLAQAAGQPIHLSGSGSTLFTLFASGPAAAFFARLCQQRFAHRVRALAVRIYRPQEVPGT
ncbi:MAG: 4-(cytidine 5'-diphospho)-2-C-methyl-D-erythritol kinase [Phycisphaerae bacterium]|nr:4-(cytidine 5'-diphospho)-2-C-methyl-D-erythritol kinase [Phycisphaerae bacterium]